MKWITLSLLENQIDIRLIFLATREKVKEELYHENT